jgi:hypothetical protein
MNNDPLKNIDFNSPFVSESELAIIQALSKHVNRETNKLTPPPIAPLADPVNIGELVDDSIQYSIQEIESLAQKVDSLYSDLSNTNNSYMADIESAEKTILETTDAVQNITALTQDQDSNYLWVSDSFNTNSYVDLDKSTTLVDTDMGNTSLGVQEFYSIPNVTVDLERDGLVGIPGCNLLALDSKSLSNIDVEPSPTLEKTEVKDLAGLADNNNQTWFEIERNLVPLNQPVRRAGRAWVYNLGANKENVKAITSDYDWKATIVYPDGFVDAGPDKAGTYVVEWLEDNVNPLNSATYNAKLEVKMTLLTPQPVSEVKIVPFIRSNQGQMALETLYIVTDGQTIPIARNVDLTVQAKSTKTLQKEILRRTGSSSIGAVFTVPTNRDISEIKMVFSGKPYQVTTGLAHQFSEEFVEKRTVRKYGLFSSVDRRKAWERKPTTEETPTISVESKQLNLLGSTQPFFNSIYELGGGTNSILNGDSGNILTSLSNLPGLAPRIVAGRGRYGLPELQQSKVGAALGKAGAFLSKVTPYIGAGLAVVDLIKNAFGTSKTIKTLEKVTGYDIFSGFRSYVAIRDITLTRSVYSTVSEVLSKKRSFSRPVRLVGLIVDYTVPSEWGQGDWISFYLSTDGTNWSPVIPLSDTTLESSFQLEKPSQDIYFKAVLKGNPDDPFRSPYLNHYTLQGVPE